VQSKYFLDTDVKGLDIDVTTEDGVVTLRGTVDTQAERRPVPGRRWLRASRAITEGVSRVVNRLTLGPDR
jgi:osmotically-inducible protein OsmY